MRIIGFSFTKILIEKEEKTKQELQVNQNINIKDVLEEEVLFSKDKMIKILFRLTINYSDEYAKIDFEGSILISAEKDEDKQIIESWKNKKLPENMRIPIFNFIMNKCNIKALYLEDELGLPFHIPMPKVTIQNKKDN